MRDASKTQGGHEIGELVGDKLLYSYEGLSPHRHHLWIYQCLNCGELKGPATFSHINRYLLCSSCRIGKDNPQFKGYEDISGIFINSAKSGAKRRNLEWSVSLKSLWEQWLKQKGLCFYTAKPLKLLKTGLTWKECNASLDRRDNTKGYIDGNVLWVDKNINRMKSDFLEEDFLDMCRKVAKQHPA